MELTDNALLSQHPNFKGNLEDLKHFLALAHSRIRNSKRGDALEEWENYKKGRQISACLQGNNKLLTKYKHIQSLTARVINLSGANLDGIIVGYADLRGVILDGCSLRGAWLKGSKLENASLRAADLSPDDSGRNSRLLRSDFRQADLSGANLRGVDLSYTIFNDAILSEADLSDADLQRASLVHAKIQGAILKNARVYGISAWDVEGVPANQQDLIITPQLTESKHDDHLGISVDNLKMAQFIYLLVNNKQIRDVIDTITSKVVLILGRFSPERKYVLDGLRDELRKHNYTPMLFDFERPSGKNYIETVCTLAGMAKFVIADLTDAKIVIQELENIVCKFPSLPFQPILLKGTKIPVSTLVDFGSYRNFMKMHIYTDSESLLSSIMSNILVPVKEKIDEIRFIRYEIERMTSELNKEAQDSQDDK